MKMTLFWHKDALYLVWLKSTQWFCSSRFLDFVFLLFCNYHPLGKGPSFKQTVIPFTQGCFMLSLVEIGPVILEKILKFRQCIFTISSSSPLRKGRGPIFEQTWIPFTQECIVPSLVEIGQVVLENKILKFRQRIFTISLLSLLGKESGPSFKQAWILVTQGSFVHSMAEIGQWF